MLYDAYCKSIIKHYLLLNTLTAKEASLHVLPLLPQSAQELLPGRFINSAIILLFFSIFYEVLADLSCVGIRTMNHIQHRNCGEQKYCGTDT